MVHIGDAGPVQWNKAGKGVMVGGVATAAAVAGHGGRGQTSGI